MRAPRKYTSPASGRSRPISSFATVDLPQPDSPTMPKVSPLWMAKLTPCTAGLRLCPNRWAPFGST